MSLMQPLPVFDRITEATLIKEVWSALSCGIKTVNAQQLFRRNDLISLG